MINSGLIADGSVRGIVGGTHFNRCKKIHPIAALAFRIIHFNHFIETYEKSNSIEKLTLAEVMENLEYENRTHETERAKLQLKDILDNYHIYTEMTRSGQHGCTAQFVLMYIDLVENYQLFEYSIRTTDLNMYIYAARKMCSIFFTFNHQNYSRWLTKNIDDLMNIDQTHPGLRDHLESGALSVRRTTKNFSRSPVDLTLEQTINANAANKLTGMTSFTNSIYARQRWSETHTARKAIISYLFEYLKLDELNENCTSDHQNQIFNSHVEKFMKEVQANIDPFCEDIDCSKLFNLSTGMAASEETVEFILKAEKNGTVQMEEFIKECQDNSGRFHKPIKKNVINNFANGILKRKGSSKGAVDEAKHERNILGQILCLAMRNSINLEMVLSFPLTSVPYSLANIDGTMIQSSKKNELMSILMAKHGNEHSSSSGHDVEVIDGVYLLNILKDTPTKYGLFASFFLKFICKTAAREVHIIFDKTTEIPSLKDLNLRAKEMRSSSSCIKINGPNQERVYSLAKCLLHHGFKDELVKFLINQWSTSKPDEIIEIIGEKRIFISFGEQCHLFCKNYEFGKILSSFQNNHPEVESKMIFHMNKILATDILVRTSEPEKMLVYLIYNMQSWKNEKQIWMEIGDVKKNTSEQINVNNIYSELDMNFVKALPAWYIFTGCDYEPSFYGKGRKTCFKYFEKSTEYQVAFANFGMHEPTDRDIELIEKYTCQLYNMECKKVNDARVQIFQRAYTTKKGIDFTKKGSSKTLVFL